MGDPLALMRPAAARPAAAWRLAALAVGIAGLVALGGWLGDGLVGVALPPGAAVSCSALDPLWIGIAAIYVLAMALPFVPGIEIGLALMLLLGADGVVLVYAATQLALATSFMCGRMLPRPQLVRWIESLRPGTADALWSCLDAPRPADRLRCLAGVSRAPWLNRLLRHRCLALALALNLPGNAVFGGAGGIALVAGSSGLFGFVRFSLLSAAATSPLPLLLLLRSAA